jgi:hypothetical protein
MTLLHRANFNGLSGSDIITIYGRATVNGETVIVSAIWLWAAPGGGLPDPNAGYFDAPVTSGLTQIGTLDVCPSLDTGTISQPYATVIPSSDASHFRCANAPEPTAAVGKTGSIHLNQGLFSIKVTGGIQLRPFLTLDRQTEAYLIEVIDDPLPANCPGAPVILDSGELLGMLLDRPNNRQALVFPGSRMPSCS